jgi:uncharacterized protein
LNDVESELIKETQKWMLRAKELKSRVAPGGDEGFLDNISAYISDSSYFLEKGDPIRAFEAVIWAWAWMEIGLGQGLDNTQVEESD